MTVYGGGQQEGVSHSPAQQLPGRDAPREATALYQAAASLLLHWVPQTSPSAGFTYALHPSQHTSDLCRPWGRSGMCLNFSKSRVLNRSWALQWQPKQILKSSHSHPGLPWLQLVGWSLLGTRQHDAPRPSILHRTSSCWCQRSFLAIARGRKR